MNQQHKDLASVEAPGEDDYPELTNVWELSVKATHHFLSDGDIAFYRNLIEKEALYTVELYCVKSDEGKITGFMGIDGDKLEMLFIAPGMRKKGVGKMLLTYALEQLGITKVDVNEQNQQAIGFYEHFGFRIEDRSEVDSSGKPYPILHMTI